MTCGSRRLLLVVVLLLAATLAQCGQQTKKKGSVKKQLNFDEPSAEPSIAPTPVKKVEKKLPEVKLSLGRVAGLWMESRDARPFAAFTAIPYAQPPVEDLRFKAPRPVESWPAVRQSVGLEDVPKCVQPLPGGDGATGQEDCLYLNVFTPAASSDGKVSDDKNLPVMVWIHGGSFTWGSGASHGPEYLLDKDIVLVTINYRLGALGFLSTEDMECAGNWGLKDQSLALKWVHDHIKQFGGSPERVTIAGDSAGGVSTHMHVVSQRSKGLFQRAISQSGTALFLSLPLTSGLARRRAQRLAEELGCPTTPSWKLVLCVRKKPAAEIASKGEVLREWGVLPVFVWGPVVEDFNNEPKLYEEPFLDEQPVDTLSNGMGQDVPWMSGMTLSEGGFVVAAMLRNARDLETLDLEFSRLVPLGLGYADSALEPDMVTSEIRNYYFGATNITMASIKEVINMFTDAFALSGLDEAMRLHAAFSSAPSYMYLFNHRGELSYSEVVGGGKTDYGVVHADDLQYLFNLAEQPRTRSMTPEDRKVSDLLIDLWTNFMRAGNPTPKGNQRYKFEWQPVESDDLEFVEVGQDGRLLRGTGMLGHRAHFWASLPLSDRHDRNMRASFPGGPTRDEL